MNTLSPQPATVKLDPAVGVLCRDGHPVYYAYIRGAYHESRNAETINGQVEYAKAHGAALHLDRRYHCGFPYCPPAVGSSAYKKLPRVRLSRDWADYTKDTVFVLIETIHCGPKTVTNDDDGVVTVHPTNCRVMLEGETLPSAEAGADSCRTVPGEITEQADDVMTAVQDAQAIAEREAKECDFKFTRSRGRYFCSTSEGGVCRPFQPGDDIRWNGTIRSIKKGVAEILARYPDVTELSIDGGYDGSEYFNFDDYSPWIACWTVVVWRRKQGFLFRCLK